MAASREGADTATDSSSNPLVVDTGSGSEDEAAAAEESGTKKRKKDSADKGSGNHRGVTLRTFF